MSEEEPSNDPTEMMDGAVDERRASNRGGHRRMTTDPEHIREWAESRDAVPVSTHGGEGHGHSFVRQGELGDEHEEQSWDEFTETFRNEDLVFVYEEYERAEAGMGDGMEMEMEMEMEHESNADMDELEADADTAEMAADAERARAGGDEDMRGRDLGTFELINRTEAFDRAELGGSDLEDQLRQGERVTTELVETQVIEREITERDTIESEVINTEIVERHVVDSELVDRDVVDIEFVDADYIEVTTDETRLETIEEIERYTVESRVVDVDIDHSEAISRDEIETDMALESVQQSILESDIVRTDVEAEEVIEQEVIESQRGECDTVRSDLIERRTVEEQIDERSLMRFTLEDSEIIESELVSSELLDGEIVDSEEYETIRAGQETTTETSEMEGAGVEAQPGEMGETGERAEPGAASGEMAAADSSDEAMAGGEPGGETGVADEQPTVGDEVAATITEDDQGKDVIDETGNQIGIISAVEEGTAYVDPEPGLTDRLRARLDWGSHSSDEYPVEPSQVKDITDDEVIIRSE
ncbi:uncharacterized protein Nmag_3119 [Natrialba magadii ATCC 43099]|uniref:Uncharacterized protein n=1 Tax=Natrialba magadii (strain ATCC 43099 / DSM 3394 / CCM 3739 / CIP 104546 / IAM 13178 / JCM 8861 / NBRC 102185 / NCIMB 2190 / MS3) TaxID=547559 RepID=D3SRP7_NATMM|nr:hypothetical protein [Natrialba magadii]ADD06671.1 uncharacterized protein Nmag_3119 [Natrialba magadii ATCC 43099]ELY31868.1 hypothetical protein C500_04803 [Natrialba magadii ATCC 43099]